MYRFLIYQGGELQQIQTIQDDYTTIGRNKYAHVLLNHKQVSRQHAILQKREDGIWLEEFRKTNGIVVNGTQMTEQILLQDGDEVVIGPYKLLYQIQNQASIEKTNPFEISLEAILSPEINSISTMKQRPQEVDESETEYNSLPDIEAILAKEESKKKQRHAHLRDLGDKTSRIYPLEFRKCTILGSSGRAQVPIYGKKWFSPKEPAQIFRGADVIELKAQGLFANVRVNGKRTKSQVLKNHDVIQIEDSSFRYMEYVHQK